MKPRDITVKTFDDKQIAKLIKKAPKLLQQYIQALIANNTRQKELTQKAIAKLKRSQQAKEEANKRYENSSNKQDKIEAFQEGIKWLIK